MTCTTRTPSGTNVECVVSFQAEVNWVAGKRVYPLIYKISQLFAILLQHHIQLLNQYLSTPLRTEPLTVRGKNMSS